MKHELGVEIPAVATEDWPGQYDMFSWIEYVLNVPYPIFVLTTRKNNGKSNACLCSWGYFTGKGSGFYAVFSLSRTGHTYQNIKRDHEFCINIPILRDREKMFATIANNGEELDEIAESGLTPEPAAVIGVPRIRECPVSLECRFAWERELFEGSTENVICGKAVHLAAEERAFQIDHRRRIADMSIMYNIRGQLNPLTGETSSDTVGVLDSAAG